MEWGFLSSNFWVPDGFDSDEFWGKVLDLLAASFSFSPVNSKVDAGLCFVSRAFDLHSCQAEAEYTLKQRQTCLLGRRGSRRMILSHNSGFLV